MKYFLVLPCFLMAAHSVAQERLIINNSSAVYISLANGSSGAPTYLVVNNSATNAITLTGASTNSGMISESEYNMVEWDIGAAVAASAYVVPFFYFPSTSYIPATLTIKTAGVGAGVIRFSTWHTTNDNIPRPSDGSMNMYPASLPGSPSNTDDSYNVVDRFWVVDAGSGAYTTQPDPELTFTYLSAANASSEVSGSNNAIDGTMLVQRFNNGLGTWGDYLGPVGTTAAGSGANTKTVSTWNGGGNDVTAAKFFRSWTLASSSHPMPIQLISFTAECHNYTALIQWITASEINNDYFTIERTQDGLNYETVATVKGIGTSTTQHSYSAVDESPLPGTAYYRISQTDMDGKTTRVSTTVYTPCENAATVYAFARNANTIVAQVNDTVAGMLTFNLINEMGQTIFSQNRNASVGLNIYQFNAQVTGGIYILQVIGNGTSYTKKLILGAQ